MMLRSDTPHVSVVIPTHNQARLVGRVGVAWSKLKPPDGRRLVWTVRYGLLTSFLCLILSYLGIGSPIGFLREFWYLGHIGILGGLRYLALYVLACAALVPILFSTSRAIQIVGAGLLWFFIVVDSCSRAIFETGISFREAELLLSEISFAKEGILGYRSTIISSILSAAVALVCLAVAGRFARFRLSKRWLILPAASLALTYQYLAKQPYRDRLPSPFRIPTMVALVVNEAQQCVPRNPIAIPLPEAASSATSPRLVVFVIDESVRGDALSVNGAPIDTTPYLRSAKGLVNLGLANSSTTQSATSHFVLRVGLRTDQIPDKQRLGSKMPTIFRYAKAANYKTYLLDGQLSGGRLNAFSCREDLRDVDELYQPEHGGDLKNDYLLLHKLMEIQRKNERAFVYVIKIGAHVPYELRYPRDQRVFEPTMSPDESFGLKGLDRARVVNSYGNAIRWSVDGFWKELLQSMDREDSLIVYTSDHGQALGEGGKWGPALLNPSSGQASVPLILAGAYADSKFKGSPITCDRFINKGSHFQIFPSLLIAMGYDEDAVIRSYGGPLWIQSDARRFFLTGDVLGRGKFARHEFLPEAPSAGVAAGWCTKSGPSKAVE